jgi:hypothetical protein
MKESSPPSAPTDPGTARRVRPSDEDLLHIQTGLAESRGWTRCGGYARGADRVGAHGRAPGAGSSALGRTRLTIGADSGRRPPPLWPGAPSAIRGDSRPARCWLVRQCGYRRASHGCALRTAPAGDDPALPAGGESSRDVSRRGSRSSRARGATLRRARAARLLVCGIHAHGFLRARCSSCRKEMLVAFSCKLRGVCPSCNARRTCSTAAHLTDRVFPEVEERSSARWSARRCSRSQASAGAHSPMGAQRSVRTATPPREDLPTAPPSIAAPRSPDHFDPAPD